VTIAFTLVELLLVNGGNRAVTNRMMHGRGNRGHRAIRPRIPEKNSFDTDE
jgi:hypothetical protein